MIVRNIKNSKKVKCPQGQFISNRYLLKNDGMGYTMTRTVIKKGLNKVWFYKNHFESCYCIKGHGFLIDLESGQKHEIKKHTMYALNKHERHQLLVLETMILICVFNPPLNGNEIHGKDGSYE